MAEPRAKRTKPSAPPPTQAEPICPVAFCPICLAVTAVADLKPELMEHLLLAGREMLLAVRTVIDQRLETMDEASGSTLQRITID